MVNAKRGAGSIHRNSLACPVEQERVDVQLRIKRAAREVRIARGDRRFRELLDCAAAPVTSDRRLLGVAERRSRHVVKAGDKLRARRGVCGSEDH